MALVSSIRGQLIVIQLPLDIEEFQLTRMGITGSSRTTLTQPPTMMTYAIHGFRIRILLGRIQAALYSDCSITRTERLSRGEKLYNVLETWSADTPPPRQPPDGGALSFFLTEDFHNVSYNYALLQIYRIQIADRKNTTPDEIFLKCMQASKNICRSFRRQFLGKPTAYTWSAVHEMFLAGLTYIYCLWTSAACREVTRNDQLSSTCTDCTVVLVVLGERWTCATPFRDVFELLSARTITMMADLQQGRQPGPSPLHIAKETSPTDLDQWIEGIYNTGSTLGADWLLNELIEKS